MEITVLELMALEFKVREYEKLIRALVNGFKDKEFEPLASYVREQDAKIFCDAAAIRNNQEEVCARCCSYQYREGHCNLNKCFMKPHDTCNGFSLEKGNSQQIQKV
jgi:hypothetical protein